MRRVHSGELALGPVSTAWLDARSAIVQLHSPPPRSDVKSTALPLGAVRHTQPAAAAAIGSVNGEEAAASLCFQSSSRRSSSAHTSSANRRGQLQPKRGGSAGTTHSDETPWKGSPSHDRSSETRDEEEAEVAAAAAAAAMSVRCSCCALILACVRWTARANRNSAPLSPFSCPPCPVLLFAVVCDSMDVRDDWRLAAGADRGEAVAAAAESPAPRSSAASSRCEPAEFIDRRGCAGMHKQQKKKRQQTRRSDAPRAAVCSALLCSAGRVAVSLLRWSELDCARHATVRSKRRKHARDEQTICAAAAAADWPPVAATRAQSSSPARFRMPGH